MDLIISVGHTLIGKGTGAVGFLNESVCTREIGERVKAILEARGHNVIYLRVDQSNNDLYDRVSKANASNGTLFVEIHLNAGGGVGCEVYTYGAKEVKEARQVLNNIVALGFRNRGIKDGKNLYVIKNTNMTAMLIECCFVDTKEDADRYNPDLIAWAIANGLSVEGKIDTTIISKPIVNQQLINQGNSWVKKLQETLNRVYNSGLVVDGIVGSKTLGACRVLQYGSTGDFVKVIQEKLNSLGYNTNGIDGLYYNGTVNAVKAFQRDNGLSVDGILGQQSYSVLLRK